MTAKPKGAMAPLCSKSGNAVANGPVIAKASAAAAARVRSLAAH